ncbi:MAG: PASTA domain-containing protein [Bacteroidales bacterium]|jgi:beta-lactam-binding protein with PASTA domain|nr:PASTA domain-containing protein [Bacteroidales bacterium]
MNVFKFVFSKVFLRHLIFSVIAGFILIFVIFLWVRIYTNHGKTIPVPDFKGLTEKNMYNVAKEHNLRLEVSDSIFIEEMPRGVVVEQNPKPDFKVKKNRRIFIILNSIVPGKVRMPDVVGVSLRQAKEKLMSMNILIGKLIYVPDIAVNSVLKQQINGVDINFDTLIPKGTKIDLVLGKGLSNKTTQMPDLFAYTYIEAKDMIIGSALNSGAIIFDESVVNADDSASAKVWRQYPAYVVDRRIQLGSSVDLWLTVDSTHFVADTMGTFIDEKLNLEAE